MRDTNMFGKTKKCVAFDSRNRERKAPSALHVKRRGEEEEEGRRRLLRAARKKQKSESEEEEEKKGSKGPRLLLIYLP